MRRASGGGPLGKIVIRPQFASVLDFSEGLAFVQFGNRGVAYIDKSGSRVITAQQGTRRRWPERRRDY